MMLSASGVFNRFLNNIMPQQVNVEAPNDLLQCSIHSCQRFDDDVDEVDGRIDERHMTEATVHVAHRYSAV
jgi:hypothetical protein